MGILNVTPDSFSDGGLFISADHAIQQASDMIHAGASVIDIGGESTRPGAQPVTVSEEYQRVIPVVIKLKQQFPRAIISVDTRKPEIMHEAIKAGAHLINDVYALRAPGALEVIADSNVAVCLMHMQGEPGTMQTKPVYTNVVDEVYEFLASRIAACVAAGISRQRIVIDPGFGFGKTLDHNLMLMKHLHKFRQLGVALMVGVSRKSMIGAITQSPVEQRLIGSVTLAALAVWLGANIIRVHDVAPSCEVVKVVDAVYSI